MRETIIDKNWWYIYIIELDNYGKKTHHFGLTKAYYTGITMDIGRRFGDYIYRRRKEGYVNRYWGNARKNPVYIEYLFGDEYDAMKREGEIKRMNPHYKRKLINANTNVLVGYKPTQFLILRHYNGESDIPLKIH